MSLADIRFQPGLNLAAAGETYSQTGVVQLAGALESQAAESIAAVLRSLPYVIVAPDEGNQTLVISDEVVARFGQDKVRGFLNETIKRAARGFAFIHKSYALQDEYARAPEQPIARVTEFLQSRAFLDVGEVITGSRIDGVRVQASCYRKGDFLTLHDDTHSRDDRVAAFTLGFTRNWRPDWGGQLLFHDAKGDIERGFGPGFNVLTVFKVPRAHSVAQVAAYAGELRLSLTGWFIRETA